MGKKPTSKNLPFMFAVLATVAVLACVAVLAVVLRNRQPDSGFVKIPGTSIIVKTGNFFQDTDEGRNLDASLNTAMSSLQGSQKASVDAKMKDEVTKFTQAFDSYNRDLRTSLQSAYNGLIAGLSVTANNPDGQSKVLDQYNQIIDLASKRTSQLRALNTQLNAYLAQPSPEGLEDLGKSLRAMFATEENRSQADGLSRLIDDALGNSHHPLGVWMYNSGGTGRIELPFSISGETRITGNIDKTPFMQRMRNVRLTLRNVDDAGIAAFQAHVKTDIDFAPDGDGQLDGTKNMGNNDTILVRQANGDDQAYYLAWRGATMTKEEFKRRYPDTVIVLELVD
jgi:hypothetical protein